MASFGIRSARRTALLIGINDSDPRHRLEGGAADVGYMRTALLKYGFQSSDITVLLNGEATRARILYELGRLGARTSAGGMAVLSVSTHGSGQSFRTADDARVYANEVARYLGRIHALVWTALAICYAGAFAQPGTTGPNRIATFSSDAQHESWEMGKDGSEFFYYMVNKGMIDGGGSSSVEEAFQYARSTMSAAGARSIPAMSDGTTGNVALG